MKIAGAILAIVFVSPLVRAQIPTSGNVFFGYTYTGADISSGHCNTSCPPGIGFLVPPTHSAGLNGWDASVEGKFLPWIGIVGDISQSYGSQDFTLVCMVQGCPASRRKVDGRLLTVLFGPRVSISVGKFTPFAHAMFGIGHMSDSGAASNSDTSFATVLGGGLDYKLIKGIAWRVEGDELHTSFFDAGQNHFRFSTGIVVRF